MAKERRRSGVTLACKQCGKRLSRKTARLIDGRVLCSSCMFGPSPLDRAKASHRPMRDIDEILCIEREPASDDTRPQGGDADAAPFTSGAVGEAETPKTQSNPSVGGQKP